jgi:DNA-binding CsgD family transcriptional regulator
MPETATKSSRSRQRRQPPEPVRQILSCGSAIFSNSVWMELARSLRLTGRELQIVRGVFDDRTEAAIADDLGISAHTVHTHLQRLREKLEVMDRATLILQVVEEFLRLTSAPCSQLPPICGARAAGLCHLRD